MKKKIKNKCSQTCSEDVGKEVNPISRAGRHKKLLHQFGQATVSDADDNGKPHGSFPIFYTIGNKLFAVTP